MITRIVVPVDDDHASEQAIPIAGALARATGATLELVTIDPVGLEPAWAQRRLDDLIRRVPTGIVVETTVEPTTESVAGALAHLVREPGTILCLATHGRGALLSLALGSVTADLVRHTDLPVLIVGPACTTGPAGLGGVAVTALDGSETDEEVMDAATMWSEATGAPITVTTTITRPGEPESWTDADRLLAWAEEAAAERGTAVATSLVAASDVDEGILRALDGTPGCLVVGSHRRGPLGRMVFGSTVTRLAHSAPCPVLVAARHVAQPAVAASGSRAADG